MLKIEIYPVGELAANCCIITDEDTGEVAVIDPGDKSLELERAVNALKTQIKYILLTHGHYDHIGFVSELKKSTGAKVAIGKNDGEMLKERSLNLANDFGGDISPVSADILLSDGDTLTLGSTEIKIISLPGHTKGGTGYLADGRLFCGDTLFKGSMGRTDFPGGDENEIMQSLKRLAALPDDTAVYCGHGPNTTIGEEKAHNPCMIYALERF